MSVLVRRNRKLTEDDEQQTQQTQQPSSNASVVAAEIEKCNQDIIKCQNAINIAEQRYQEEKKKQNDNIVQLQQRIAELGGNAVEPATNNESNKIKFNFSKKLYEAVVPNGKTDELAAAAQEAFNNLPNISYYMDDKGCLTLAKRMLSFLNDNLWNDGENHWDDVAEFLVNTLSKANISLSSREMGEFISEFGNVLKTKTMFSWIFGRSAVEKNQADSTPTEDIQNIDTKEDNLNTEQESLYDPYDDPYEDLDYLPYEL